LLRWYKKAFMDEKNPTPDTVEDATPFDSAVYEDGPSQLAAVMAERDQLAAEKAELQDRFLRRQAEFENYRRRIERERSEFTQYAASEAVAAMLPVLDDLERALKQETSDREYQRGTELIYQRLFEGLKKLGLEPITSAGQPFDPYVHQAVERVETDEAEDQTVLEEFQPGYNFKGRLLRPAMVRVAVTPVAKS
jgi:molecular chaperone GrpE